MWLSWLHYRFPARHMSWGWPSKKRLEEGGFSKQGFRLTRRMLPIRLLFALGQVIWRGRWKEQQVLGRGSLAYWLSYFVLLSCPKNGPHSDYFPLPSASQGKKIGPCAPLIGLFVCPSWWVSRNIFCSARRYDIIVMSMRPFSGCFGARDSRRCPRS